MPIDPARGKQAPIAKAPLRGDTKAAGDGFESGKVVGHVEWCGAGAVTADQRPPRGFAAGNRRYPDKRTKRTAADARAR